jgi:hypothetical protein
MHPHAKEEKSHRRAKHRSLGVHGEHDDEKAERLCRAHGGGVPEGPSPPKPHEPNPAHLKGD